MLVEPLPGSHDWPIGIGGRSPKRKCPPMRLRPVLAAILLVGSACGRPTGETAVKPDRAVITREQLIAAHFTSVYDAVQGLRSNWLQTRGADSFSMPTEVKVYLDNTLLGGVETLRAIAPASVSYVRYYDGIAATTRWGLGHGAGAIYVSTLPEKPLPR